MRPSMEGTENGCQSVVKVQMREGFRFKPPPVEIRPEAEWAIARAFMPGDCRTALEATVDPEGLLEAARELGLAARIGARTDRAVLQEEAGAAAGEFWEAARTTAIAMLQLEGACRHLAGFGQRVGVPVIFLKGMALHLAEKVPLGERGASDVDVLVPKVGLNAFVAALVEAGWKQEPTQGPEHHVPPLYHPAGVGVEVHTVFRGVRLADGSQSADAEAVLGAGLCDRLPRLPGDAWIPGEELLVAHLLVHGIAQHGGAPQTYPLFRVLTDVADLQWTTDRLERFLAGAYRWIAGDVSEQEIRAMASLAARLRSGEPPASIAQGDDLEAAWLRHLVLGALDGQYRQSLRLGHLASIVPAGAAWKTRLRTVRGALLINDRQVELIYGRPASRWGYWGWKVWRPFDLVVRAARYGSAWVRTAIRRRSQE